MSRNDPQMKIRLPLELKESIEAASTANSRTMNSEIVARLQASFHIPPAGADGTDDWMEAIYAAVDKRFEALRAKHFGELSAASGSGDGPAILDNALPTRAAGRPKPQDQRVVKRPASSKA